jgi:hypothetical protein
MGYKSMTNQEKVARFQSIIAKCAAQFPKASKVRREALIYRMYRAFDELEELGMMKVENHGYRG